MCVQWFLFLFAFAFALVFLFSFCLFVGLFIVFGSRNVISRQYKRKETTETEAQRRERERGREWESNGKQRRLRSAALSWKVDMVEWLHSKPNHAIFLLLGALKSQRHYNSRIKQQQWANEKKKIESRLRYDRNYLGWKLKAGIHGFEGAERERIFYTSVRLHACSE